MKSIALWLSLLSAAIILVAWTQLARPADSQRQTETKNVIADATSYAGSHGHVPVIYAGDFNSHDGHNHAFETKDTRSLVENSNRQRFRDPISTTGQVAR